jgi:hypothetical protein
MRHIGLRLMQQVEEQWLIPQAAMTESYPKT